MAPEERPDRKLPGSAAAREAAWWKYGGPGVFAPSFLLYLYTLAPTVLWGDDAKFQRMAVLLELEAHEMGHPLWVLTAHLFTFLPVGELAYRVSLSSALFSALAVLLLFIIIRRYSGSGWGAVLGAASLAVSHTFWLHAVRTEVYALNSLLFFLVLWLLLPLVAEAGTGGGSVPWWRVGLAGFAFALALSNHLLLGVFIPGLAYLLAIGLLRRRIGVSALVFGGLLFGLGLAPCLLLVSQAAQEARVGGVIADTLARLARPETPLQDAALFLGYTGYQFVGVAGLAGVVGFVHSWRRDRRLAVALLLLYLGAVAFAFDYGVPDRYAFYLPSYLIFAIWCGLGFADIVRRRPPKPLFLPGAVMPMALLVAVIAIPTLVYHTAPSLLRAWAFVPADVRELPERDSLTFHLIPDKRGYDGALRFARETFRTLPPEAVLIADFVMAAPLQYLQAVEGYRPDVNIAEVYRQDQLAYAQQNYLSHPLFIAHVDKYYDVEGLRSWFDILPAGPVYRLERHPPD